MSKASGPRPGAEAERARRYLLEGKADLALGTCEAALAAAKAEDALSLHLTAASAAEAMGDLAAQVSQLERAETLARERHLGVLGTVRVQLGQVHLKRNQPSDALVVLEEALGELDADDPLRSRVETLAAEAREREGDVEPEPEPERRDVAALAPAEWTERLLGMVDRLQDADPDMDLAALLDLILAELVDAVSAGRGFVLLRQPDESLVVRAARDAHGFQVIDPAKQVSRKIADRAAAEHRSLRAVRPAEDPRFAGSRSAKALDLEAVVAAPLRYRRQNLGSVVLDRRAADVAPFDEAAEALVARFARIASGVIVRTRRRDAQKRRTEALTDLFARTSEQFTTSAESPIVGQSEAVFKLLRILARVAPTSTRVLIRGESGTGKELVARELHRASRRREQPFMTLNCAALTESLIESELFGYVKGAFSGAEADRPGLFEHADGGTVFLDEIGDASPRLQAELLRVLQEGEVRRVGDPTPRKVDVRVVTATHRNLEAMVAEGLFREDLLYRINTIELTVPSLRERVEDVPLLVRHFFDLAVKDLPNSDLAPALDEDTLEALCDRDYSGNVRELSNVVTRFVTLGQLDEADESLSPKRVGPSLLNDPILASQRVLTLVEAERRAIVAAIASCDGVKSDAAKALGISRRTLYNKIRSHGIADD